jgi:hypothetical protein
MGGEPELPTDWTKPKKRAWERIAAGELADFNARDREQHPEFKDLDPRNATGWDDNRRLSAKFLQTILTDKAFVDATPYHGVRIRGALIDDAPVDLEHARLQRLFWLEKSRILVGVKGSNVRVDGELSLEASFVSGGFTLNGAEIREGLSLAAGHYKSNVNLNRAKINGSAFLRGGATFKGEVDLGSAAIGSTLDMTGSIFEKRVSLNRTTVIGSAFLRGGATFKDEVDLRSATIGSNLEMTSSTFEDKVSLNGATVTDSAYLRGGATFSPSSAVRGLDDG